MAVICISLVTSYIPHLSSASGSLVISRVISLYLLYPIWIELSFFLFLNYKFFPYPWHKTFTRWIIWQYVLVIYGSSFHLLKDTLWSTDVLIWPNLTYQLLSNTFAFHIINLNYCAAQDHKYLFLRGWCCRFCFCLHPSSSFICYVTLELTFSQVHTFTAVIS